MAGPVVPLTGTNVGSEQVLLGGPGESPGATVGLSTDDAVAAQNIQHTVRYTDMAPDRFKDFWRD